MVIPENLAQVRQTYLLDSDSLDRNWSRLLEKEGSMVIRAMVPQYLSQRKVGENYLPFKKTVPLVQALVFKMKDATDEKELDIKKQIVERFFKVKRDKVREIVLINSINEGFEQATGIEVNDEMRELIELGVFTEEDIKKQVTIRGNRVSEMVFLQPAVTKNRDTGEVSLQMTDDKYAPEALIVPFIDGEDDYAEEKPAETVGISEDAFEELFG